jgi:hypothetical protein
MTSYIVCLQSAAAAAFEVAFCESDDEARDWADQVLAFAPGFELAGILRGGAAPQEGVSA